MIFFIIQLLPIQSVNYQSNYNKRHNVRIYLQEHGTNTKIYGSKTILTTFIRLIFCRCEALRPPFNTEAAIRRKAISEKRNIFKLKNTFQILVGK